MLADLDLDLVHSLVLHDAAGLDWCGELQSHLLDLGWRHGVEWSVVVVKVKSQADCIWLAHEAQR